MIIKDVLHGMLNIFCPLYFFCHDICQEKQIFLDSKFFSRCFSYTQFLTNNWHHDSYKNVSKRFIGIYRKIIQWNKYVAYHHICKIFRFRTSYRMHALWYTYLKNRNLCLTLWHVHLIPLLVGHGNLRNLVTSTCVNLQEGIYGKMWVANAFYTPTYCLFCIL